MLRENDNAVVLAEPGIGKSTAVAKVLWEQCGWLRDARRGAKPTEAPYGPVVPITLPSDLHGCASVAEALAREWERVTGSKPDAWLFESSPPFGTCWLVLIDGLDQVLDLPARQRVVELLGAWPTGDCRRLMITTRPLLGWELGYLKAGNFGFFRLAKFSTAGLCLFAERWERNRSDNPIHPAPLSAAKFLACVRSVPLASLVRVPLIATITYLLLEAQGESQPLPASRDALYERYVLHLLSSRALGPPPPAFAVHGAAGRRAWSWCSKNLRALLEGTADLSLTVGASTVHDCAVNWIESRAPDGMLAEVPGWEDALDALLTSTSLIVPDRGELAFAHPSFAEYLAAGPRSAAGFDPEVWLADASSPESRGLALFVLGRRCRRVGPGLADSMVELLLDRGGVDACTAGEVVAEGIGISAVLRSRVVDRLFDILTTDDLDTGAALRVLGALGADQAVGDGLAGFAADAAHPGWVRADVADELCDLDGERGVRSLRKIREQTSDTWLRRRILLKLLLLGVATDTERTRAEYEFTVAQSGPASSGARAGEWFRQVAESVTNTPAQRLSAALALAERRDDGWKPLVLTLLIDRQLSPENRFQAARRLSADPEGVELLEGVADRHKKGVHVLEVVVPVLAALSGAQNEWARQRLNELQWTKRQALAEQFPHLDAWREEIGTRSYSQREDLPPRDPYFTGREEVLELIRTGLRRGRVCLVGNGGVGKTAIALEYAYRHADEYETVAWASGTDTLTTPGFSLPGHGRHLLILEDAGSPIDLSGQIPKHGSVSVLITSREAGWDQLCSDTISVGAFTRDESLMYLRKRLPRGMRVSDSEQLAGSLSDFPLALKVAVTTIASGMSVSEYLRRFEEIGGTLSGRSFALSLATLREEKPALLRLLECCAMFAAAPIPLNVFNTRVRVRGTYLAEVLDNEIRFNRAVTELDRLSLIKVDQQKIMVHDRIRSELRESLTEKQREEIRQEVHWLLVAAAPSDAENPTNWSRYSELLPHLIDTGITESNESDVRSLALRTMHYLRVSGSPQTALRFAKPLLECARRSSIADAFLLAPFAYAELLWELGRFREAMEIMEPPSSDGQVREEPMNLTRASARGAWLRASGRFADALDHDQHVRHVISERAQSDDLQVMQVDINMALDLALVGSFEPAEQALRMAPLDIKILNVPRARIDLARVLRLRGYLNEAQHTLDYALWIYEDVINGEHPLWLEATRERSIIDRYDGRASESLAAAQDALAGLTDVYGEHHLETLAAAVAVANSSRAVGELDDAYSMTKQTVEWYTEVVGADHPFTLACNGNLAVLLRLRGDAAAARDLNELCLAKLRGVPGIYALTVETNLASDLAALGERDAAIEGGQKAMARWTTAVGADHPFTKACAVNLKLDETGMTNPSLRQDFDFDPPRI